MKWTDKIVLFLATTLGAVALTVQVFDVPMWKVFLFKDFSVLELSSLMNSKSVSLGSVHAISGAGLKRKSEEVGYFSALNVKGNVFNGDVLVTDEHTKAVIKFTDGSQLEIAPQSMVKLDFAKAESGLLSIAKTPKIEVLKGNVFDVGTTKHLSITKSPVIAKVETKPVLKNRVSLEQIKKLELPKREIAQAEPMKVEPLLEPTPEPEVEPVPEVKPLPPVVTAPPMPKPIVSIPKPQPKPVVANKPTVLRQVMLDEPKIAGHKGVVDNVYNGEDLRSFFVDLQWEPYAGATSYTVNFYQDANKQSLWFSAKTQDPSYRLSQMFNGTLYYEVEAHKGQTKIGVSKASPLKFAYAAPELQNPQPNSELDASEMNYFFTWEKKNFTSEYIIEVGKDEKFAKTYKKVVKTNFIQMPLLTGTYYWRVFAKNGDLVSSPSQVYKIVIKP